MEEWKEYRLGELLKIRYGKDHKKLGNGNIPVYGSGGIMRTGDAYLSDKPSVLIPRKGTLSNIFFVEEPFWTVDTMFWSEINNNIVFPKYLYYAIKDYKWDSLNVGSAVPSLTVPVIESVLVSIPSVDTQIKIAAQLSEIDNKIAINRRICENLEAQAQALFKHWFIDFAPFKDGKFVESELGLIPEGWRVGKLEDFGKIICGKTPSKANKSYYGSDVPFIKIPDMHENVFILKSEDNLSIEGSNSQSNKMIPEFSIMVSCIATVGLVAMNVKPSHTNQQINSIVPYQPCYRYYVYENLKLRYKELLMLGSSGTTTYNVNTRTFSSLKILVPELRIIEIFNNVIKYHFEIILNLYQESARLATLRDTLLPKLMSGQIKV